MGRYPSTLRNFLFSVTHSARPSRSRMFSAFEYFSVESFSLNIPFLGQASFRWKEKEVKSSLDHLSFEDVVAGLSSSLFAEDLKVFAKIAELLKKSDYHAIWIGNAELSSADQFGQICIAATTIAPMMPVIVEGAFPEFSVPKIFSAFEKLCGEKHLRFFHHAIKPFNAHFARQFYDALGLQDRGIAFNFRRNAGYPAAIKFDLEEMAGPNSMSTRLQGCLKHNRNTANTLIFLSLFYAIENRYPNLIRLADQFGVTLELERLVEADVVNLSESTCELAHPRIAQFVSLTRRQELCKMVAQAYAGGRKVLGIEADLAALVHHDAFDPNDLEQLIHRGIAYVFHALSMNHLYASDNALSFIEQSIEQVAAAGHQVDICLVKQVAVTRIQIDTILCRRTGAVSFSQGPSVVEILLSAQARMRQLKLNEAIGLTEFAQASLVDSTYSEAVQNWLRFCALYIRASCLIACGKFQRYETTYEELRLLARNVPTQGRFLVALLPKTDGGGGIVDISDLPIERYLSARLMNNRAASKMFEDCSDLKIRKMLSESIKIVSEEGSVEITFPINNLGIYFLYNKNIESAIDTFFELISYSIYPYDYFCAYNNMAVSLAALGDISRAQEFIELACGYLESEELSDPVFVVKGHFNHAVIQLATGDDSLWNELSMENFDFNRMPRRYPDLFREKIDAIQKSDSVAKSLSKFQGSNVETANILWPQNLQFWDFMYPIVNVDNISEIVYHYG